MKRIIRLTESDLSRIVRRVINEQDEKCMDKDGNVIPCKHDGTDIPYENQEVPEFIVTADSSKRFYDIKLRKPNPNGYTTLRYIISSGELRGDGDKENLIMTIQKNQSKEQVTAWLKKIRYNNYRRLFKIPK